MVYHLIFSFPKLLFIEYHTIISEVCFNNREFHSSILGVILCFLGVIWGVILNFLSTFGGGCLLYRVSVHHVQKFEYRFIVFGGGTCLRIFHGLQRFSEDMDFYKIIQNI